VFAPILCTFTSIDYFDNYTITTKLHSLILQQPPTQMFK